MSSIYDILNQCPNLLHHINHKRKVRRIPYELKENISFIVNKIKSRRINCLYDPDELLCKQHLMDDYIKLNYYT